MYIEIYNITNQIYDSLIIITIKKIGAKFMCLCVKEREREIDMHKIATCNL